MDRMEPLVRVTAEPLDRAHVDELVRAVTDDGVGGIVVFEGVVRDNARGKQVRYLEYDAYPEMALQQMRQIAQEVQTRWATDRVALVHRVGRLEIGECSVVVAVGCAHRGEAFEACRYAIDTLKATVPIWKKEFYADGEEWVEG